jgi:hypothetical protein
MATIVPLTKDALVLALGAGAKTRFTIRRGALELLLLPREGVETRRVPLMLGRDAEVGELRLSKTGRTLEVRVLDPPRLFLVRAETARAFLRGELNALPLIDATDNAAEPAPIVDDSAKKAEAAARLRALAEKTRANLARQSAEDEG